MRTLNPYTLLLFAGLLFSACIDHEVIPAPENTVDLNSAFVGYVNGTQVEFTQNVNGYGAIACCRRTASTNFIWRKFNACHNDWFWSNYELLY